ncbi:MAG: site-2 protease family protein [Fimbriimonadaceae bacterium]|nr:site-2 protease family protein [Fimbriimonadaceae bacterium]
MDLLQAVLHGLTTAFTFLIVITVLIAVHELGHYWVAKLCGMHVTAFAVMVGGVRKTPLDHLLKKPLVKSSVVWAVGLVIAIATGLAGFYGQKFAFYAGLAFFATAGPLWMISRLNALYHRPFSEGIFTLLKSYAVVVLILAIGTRFQNVDVVYALSMLIGAASVAVMLAYYYPVLRTGGADVHDPAADLHDTKETVFAEGDGNKGFGEIIADHQSVPVRFRPLVSRVDRHGTEFSLLLLPLGGFASIAGMQAREDGSETTIEKGFFSKSPIKRLLTLFAGPLFSILLGMLLLFISFYGQGESVSTNIIKKVQSGSPSEKILKPGDKIVSINGAEVSDFYGIHKAVRFSYTEKDGKFIPTPLDITVERGNEIKSYTITPKISDEKSTYLITKDEASKDKKFQALLGVEAKNDFIPISASQAASAAIRTPVLGVQQLFKVFTSYQTAKESVGGPSTMVEQTSSAVQNGIWQILILAGGLSLSLGLLNLLPFPPLDGGQMVIAFIELLRGNRRLPHSMQVALHNIGGMAVLLLMLAAFTIDATRRSEANKPKEKPQVEQPAVKSSETEKEKSD